jgi:hypothetical protein
MSQTEGACFFLNLGDSSFPQPFFWLSLIDLDAIRKITGATVAFTRPRMFSKSPRYETLLIYETRFFPPCSLW